MSVKTWTVTVQEDPETKEAIIEFPDDLMAIAGWKEGDTIRWEVDEFTRACFLTKISEVENAVTDATEFTTKR